MGGAAVPGAQSNTVLPAIANALRRGRGQGHPGPWSAGSRGARAADHEAGMLGRHHSAALVQREVPVQRAERELLPRGGGGVDKFAVPRSVAPLSLKMSYRNYASALVAVLPLGFGVGLQGTGLRVI